VEIPDVHYARSGDVAIAHMVAGNGPVDIVFVRGFAGDLLSAWEQPRLVRFITELASFARVILLDKRGAGLSDRVREVPTLETRMDDLRAVIDAVGSARAILWTAQEGARLAALFAATYPERTAGLVLLYPTARGRRSTDYPWAPDDDEWRTILAEIRNGWGTTEYLSARLEDWAPTLKDDDEFRAWFIAHMRRGLSPGSALSFFRMMMDSDVSDVLPAVRVPTVVFAKPSERGEAQYFAEKVPGASVVELPRDPGSTTGSMKTATKSSCARPGCSHSRCSTRRRRSGFWRLCCSPISSARRNGRRSSGTPSGAASSGGITRAFGAAWQSTAGVRSTWPVTVSWPPSTGPVARSSVPVRSRPIFKASNYQCVWVCTPANARSWTARSPA
jgi:pimeloyl-ACP methyl ester carboxylesterase